jgi:D-beta-D-heptose 7-phosphate kinase / D-beta-D-heptose 1-phosphate adenosyltransferase
LAQSWRQAGLSVGFTNGCFDLLHPGHLKLLEAARSRCDRLLVGLNSDESIKRLKGHSRPIQSEPARALVLASLNCVDGVVIFGDASDGDTSHDDTPRELILALRPDLLVKGGEYKPENVVGADLLDSWGGKLLLVDMAHGWSTTATVSRLTALTGGGLR